MSVSRIHKYKSLSVKQMKSELKRMSLIERDRLRREALGNDLLRPRVWSDCETFTGVCGYASCKWHLAYDVNPQTGSLKENFPGVSFDEMPETCALRVAARGGMDMEATAKLLHTSRERVRQICNETAPLFATALGLVPGETFNDIWTTTGPGPKYGRGQDENGSWSNVTALRES